MNKSKFLELVKRPDLIEEKDLTRLTELTSDHPYSQIVHVLNVKGRKILNKPDFEKALNLAAVYSYDRSVLRSIIENEGQASDPVQPSLVEEKQQEMLPQEEPVKIQELPPEETPNFEWINEDPDILEQEPDQTSDKADIKEEKESDTVNLGKKDISPEPEIPDQEAIQTNESVDDVPELEKEETIATQESTLKQGSDNKEVNKVEEATETSETNKSVEPTENGAVLEDDQERDSNKDASLHSSSSQGSDDPIAMEIASSGIHAELMKNLSQLKESRQQYEEQPEDPNNRKEQIKIIDNFIKNSPVLSKPNLSADSEGISQEDLSKKSARFSEELASENLAKILFKQGKRKDAEKIYQKLIVMFPQKKSYFADQIKKLKKK